MAKAKTNWLAWGLKFIGSLLYLYVAWLLWGSAGSWFAGITTSLATVVLAVLLTAGVLSAASFFVLTLASLNMNDDKMAMWAWKHSMYAGGALFLLSVAAATNGTWGWAALAGYVLAYVGLGMESH